MIRHDRIGDDIGLFDRAMKVLAGASTMEPDYSKGSDNMREITGANTNESKRHYIADESLGGIDREYVEVDRKADVGDYVVITDNRSYGYVEGSIVKVTQLVSNNVSELDGSFLHVTSEYKTLSPTDIIRHNGERYRLVDRMAKVGEKVIAVESGVAIRAGEIYSGEKPSVYNLIGIFNVLEPVIDEKETDAPTESQPDLIDLVIRLTRKVAELEKRVNDADYKAGQALTSTSQFAEKLTDSEISVKLDGRTVARVITGSADE